MEQNQICQNSLINSIIAVVDAIKFANQMQFTVVIFIPGMLADQILRKKHTLMVELENGVSE